MTSANINSEACNNVIRRGFLQKSMIHNRSRDFINKRAKKNGGLASFIQNEDNSARVS